MRDLLNSLMWAYGIVLVIAFFLWATQQIEKWIEEDNDERSRP